MASYKGVIGGTVPWVVPPHPVSAKGAIGQVLQSCVSGRKSLCAASSPSSALTKQPSASTFYAIVIRIEGCSSMTGMGVNTPIHAMTKRISETINTNNFGACKDI